MKRPTTADILTQPPVDWVRLRNDDVLVVEPVYPRPDTLAKLEQQKEAARKLPQGNTNTEIEARRREIAKFNYLHVVLPGADAAPEYRLETRLIQKIIYHEDLALQQFDRALANGDSQDAYNLLAHVERRAPNWDGIDDRRNALLMLEARLRRKAGRPEAAMAYLEELHARRPQHPGLSDALGDTVSDIVTAAVETEQFRKARHYLGRLHRIDDQHPTLKKWNAQLQQRATGLMTEARRAEADSQWHTAAQLVKKAADIWPQTNGLLPLLRRTGTRWQRLDVGVPHLPGRTPEFFLPTGADRRREYLSSLDLFEIVGFDERPRYRTRFFEQWEPTDLGRRIAFTLRPSRGHWESRELVTAPVMAQSLQRKLEPDSPFYDERFADYVESFSIQSPLRFEMGLSRVPLRIESLFSFPLPATTVSAKSDVLSERFVEVERTENSVAYRRVVPQPDRLSAAAYHVAEVVEHRYEDSQKAIQDLIRGDLLMLTPTRLEDVAGLSQIDQLLVAKLKLPVTHVLQFNPRTKALHSRELRRALVYAVDRPRLLQETVLGGADARFGRVVTAAWPQSHSAYDHQILPRSQDLTLAVALRLAAKQALGKDLPELRIVCEPDPVVIAAARQLITDWQRTGIQVTLLNGTGQTIEQDSDDWDIVYRTVQLPEPLTQLWPFLSLDEHVTVASLRHLPDWLRRKFLDLDVAADENSATYELREMHRLLQSEVQFIPLWEVDEFVTLRREVKGLPPGAVSVYQDIEQWTVDRKLPPLWP